MITAWRLIKENMAKEAFTGEGARLYGGRWNFKGVPVVYTSGSLSLAALELFVHLEPLERKGRYVSIQAAIPEDVIEYLPPSALPSDWRDELAPDSIKEIGSLWFNERRSAALCVPSAIIPSEFNYILNPEHPEFVKIVIGLTERFCFDPRMCR